ncbi:type VII secretion protein EccB [Streptomyces sp. DvalAA-14]|uniref:type VII secretion protein EccB n=1 Tax=unclassified Streptomyces TaxID=2593676 RepID=UPI00081B589B|nr:type VII secretion protein EccB [Streptomyces sp. DvalAA-14]MYS21407.1 type VII secretion protein EccB [Streptomyces sp. SID4948]SCD91846.1 type VII secretion protein EccB [Streptomyces sp. DvalAA-14]
MQSRRDQVQAHRFVVARLTTGLMRSDPDAPESPNSRTNRGMVLGGALGVLVAVGFLVFGFISPGGSTAWQDPKTLIVEQGTGNRYLYDGTLRPIRNYASARLIVGPELASRTVPRTSLAGTPHGSAVGIDGAPDALPPAGGLDAGGWQVCAATRPDDSGQPVAATSLVVDSDQPGTGLGGGQALLVSGPDGTYYLLWHGNRFRLAAGTATADALGYGTADPLPVSATFLDALPASTDLAPPAVPGQGAAGPELDGRPTRVGQVFVVDTPGSAEQYYLLQRAGLVPISTTQAALALSGPDEREASYRGAAPVAVPIAADALNKALVPGSSVAGNEVLPAAPPALLPVGDGQAACVRLDDDGVPSGAAGSPNGGGGNRISLALVSSAALTDPAAATAKAPAAPACLPVDAVVVPPDGGSLVRALGAGGGQVGATTYLVTDAGVKYLIPSAAAAKALGYDLGAARELPSPLLAMLPTGPDLSPQDAVLGRSDTTGTPGCATPAGGATPARTASRAAARTAASTAVLPKT